MTSAALLRQAERLLDGHPAPVPLGGFIRAFEYGAEWMAEWLQRLRNDAPSSIGDPSRYRRYGLLKYGIALLVMALSVFLPGKSLIWSIPRAVVFFYAAEIQLLFLFPLMIDRVPHPLRSSVQMTWRMGWIKTVATVMPIGLYMLSGFCYVKHPLKRWYIGCLAVLIWYCHEMEHRPAP